MILFLVSLSLLLLSNLLFVTLFKFRKFCNFVFLTSIITSGFLLILSVFRVLSEKTTVYWKLACHLPLGEFYIGIDLLSAFFLFVFAIIYMCSGIYGYAYFKDYKGHKYLGVHYFFFNLLAVSIMLLVVAQNVVLFLIAWELMTVSAYFLIIFYDEKEFVRKTGLLYLIATHLGAFCLLFMFLLMNAETGSLNFDQIMLFKFSPKIASILFVLAVVGFGVKAGFIPFHIWLPYAHPVAPSHVSGLLSGVVIKIGIYGLLRVIFIVKDFPLWCGVLLLLIGVISGIGGVLYALGQHEIKRLLAYHSVENIGIITLGIAMGLIGGFYDNQLISCIGYTGALMHVFNHAVFKSLLFFSAGAVIKETHTGEIDHLGGLLKLMPWTGHMFLIGSLSICGLPFFNGFISEWLVYQSFFEGVLNFTVYGIIFSSLGAVSLALIGGLAALCFCKAFGTIFLGNARTEHKVHPMDTNTLLIIPMVILALICICVGLYPVPLVSFAFDAIRTLKNLSPINENVIFKSLFSVSNVLLTGAFIIGILFLIRKFLLGKYSCRQTETWGCGNTKVSPSMQYTASSFAEPILRIFKSVLFFKIKTIKITKYFPQDITLTTSIDDASENYMFRPLYELIFKISKKFMWIQSGITQIYLIYIFFFLIFLLGWKMM
ncbi:MAG: hypothetical protein ACD_79C01179G0004 [uncultured bacterium]|nr:MAG: hypothetical protein ACD_79C01179G0004 [uncultured bacterium]